MSEWGNRFPESTRWNNDEYFDIFLKLNQMIKPKSKILDMGCGYGEATHFFNKKGHDCIGVDIKSSDVWDKFNINCTQYDGKFFPFRENYFDVVFLNSVYEHVIDKPSFLKEARRVVKKDGLIIFILPTRKWKLSGLMDLPKLLIGGILHGRFETARWFVHEPKIYGLNYFAEFKDFGMWVKSVSRFLLVKRSFGMSNGKRQILVCKPNCP